jgi:folate-binding protein YgfZ
LHQQAEAEFLWYGPTPGAAVGESAQPAGAAVVETFGEIEGEYAALRKGCVVLDLPQRGAVRITGAERVDFLNRMVTQELKGLKPFDTRDAFWLNRRGRIDADLRIIQLSDEMYFDVDALVSAKVVESLMSFIFSEEIELKDHSESMHRLALHGPTAPALLAEISEPVDGPTVGDLAAASAGAAIVRIAGKRIIVDRRSDVGEIGFGLLMEASAVGDVYEQILERGLDGAHESGAGRFKMRPAGWAAYNIARIEAGTPMFNVDFGTNSLPAETGLLDQRVSFTKGCYLGQEVVARMKSLGHPKQTLVGLRITPEFESNPAAQPITGAPLTLPGDPDAKPIGAITSSTRSPMLGDAIICFAQVKWDLAKPGTELLVETDAGKVAAKVADSLVFWKR